jgi:hypothetical protein
MGGSPLWHAMLLTPGNRDGSNHLYFADKELKCVKKQQKLQKLPGISNPALPIMRTNAYQ